MKSGNFKEAASAFRRAVRANPDSAAAHYNLALILLRLNQRSEAQAELQKVTVLAPQIAPAHYNLALLREQGGDFSGAVEELKKVRSLDPGDAAATVHLVSDYFQAGADAAALALARATLSQSSDLRLTAQVGVVLLQNGHSREALEPLEAVIRTAPNSASVIPHLARAYIETGSPSKAEALLRHAVELNPDSAELHFDLGRAFLASTLSDTRQKGVDEINTAIRLSPENPTYYETLGRALLECDQIQIAASVLKQGIGHEPDSVNLNLLLGVAEAELHGAGAARPYIEKALALDPRAALGYNLRGNLALRTGNYDAAVREYRKALELASQNDLYAYDLALALERMNNTSEALVYAQRSVALNANRSVSHYILGKLYRKLGRDRDAIHELEACVRLDPSSDAGYYLLARLYRETADRAKAEQCMSRFNQLKTARDTRIGLSGPATASVRLLDTPAPWDNAR